MPSFSQFALSHVRPGSRAERPQARGQGPGARENGRCPLVLPPPPPPPRTVVPETGHHCSKPAIGYRGLTVGLSTRRPESLGLWGRGPLAKCPKFRRGELRQAPNLQISSPRPAECALGTWSPACVQTQAKCGAPCRPASSGELKSSQSCGSTSHFQVRQAAQRTHTVGVQQDSPPCYERVRVAYSSGTRPDEMGFTALALELELGDRPCRFGELLPHWSSALRALGVPNSPAIPVSGNPSTILNCLSSAPVSVEGHGVECIATLETNAARHMKLDD